jgi:hypothetical protein
MVREHYRRLGFTLIDEKPDGCTVWELDLDAFDMSPTFIRSRRADAPTPQLLSA